MPTLQVLEVPIILGDVPGHPFRGNQYAPDKFADVFDRGENPSYAGEMVNAKRMEREARHSHDSLEMHSDPTPGDHHYVGTKLIEAAAAQRNAGDLATYRQNYEKHHKAADELIRLAAKHVDMAGDHEFADHPGKLKDDPALKSITASIEVPIILGGPGSGNFGHKGRPGVRGGSAPKEDQDDLTNKHDKAIAATKALKDHLNDDDQRDLDDMEYYRDQAAGRIANNDIEHLPESLDNISIIHDSLANGHHTKEDEFRANKDYTNANAHGVAAGLHEDAALAADNLAASLRTKLDDAPQKDLPPTTPWKEKKPLDRSKNPSIPYDEARALTTAEKPAGVSEERWHAIRKQIHIKGGKRDKTFAEHHEFETFEDRDPVRGPFTRKPEFPAHVLSLEMPVILPGEQPEIAVDDQTAAISLGDTPGHAFHGNQWTGGAGGGVHRLDQPWPGPGRHPLFANINARQVIRWCGKEGMNAAACKAALDRAGMPTPLPTIRAELPIGARGMGRKGEQAPIYVFSPSQKAVLRGAVVKTAEGLTEAQVARGAAWLAKAGQPAPAAAAAPVAAPAAPAGPTQGSTPDPGPVSAEGYSTRKALAQQAEDDVAGIRHRLNNGDRSQAVYRDRVLAGLAAANMHRAAAQVASQDGNTEAAIRHMAKASYHDQRAQYYNAKLPNNMRAASGDNDVRNRENAIRARLGAAHDPVPGAAPSAAAPAAPPKSPEAISKLETSLLQTPVSKLEAVGGGFHVSGCYAAHDSNGKIFGYYKPQQQECGYLAPGQTVHDLPRDRKGMIARQFVQHGYTAGQCYKREQAAWEVAKVVGMDDMVPAAVERHHPDHGPGVIIDAVDGQEAEKVMNRHGDAFDGMRDCQRAAVFDYIIQNVDRHEKNWMVKPDGKVALIDHGYCLATKDNHFAYADNDQFKQHINLSKPIPTDIKDAWRGKWPQIAEGMRKCGIETTAIHLAKKRYDKFMRSTTFHEFADN